MSHPSSDLYIFGIRHHGPGSAASLRAELDGLQPDIVLVEGPADANDLLHWLGHEEMEPPVSLILYRPDEPKRAAFFPFAIFSPELQAVRYALAHEIPVRFMDLPQAHMLASPHKVTPPDADVFQMLALATGFADYEQWWNQLVEQRRDRRELFPAILALMAELRAEELATTPTLPADVAPESILLGQQREAYMRQSIRTARQEGHQRIAIVCGAWHGPALQNLGDEETDASLLTNMPHVDVEAAWVPWTYSRMSYYTGYGAGIAAPGWYHHLWKMEQQNATRTDISVHWLTKVAVLLRREGVDASAAHVIEAVRLAEALALMRQLPFPGLAELNEATQTVICFGDPTHLHLIQKELIIGERMGAVPPDTPMVPLQRDLYQLQRTLRLRPEPEKSVLSLDLRNEMHLARSHLLHRLKLLNIPWGEPMTVRGKSGTWREVWRLQWKPDYALRVIEANVWGNTVQESAAGYAQDTADNATDLASLTILLDQIILADLPDVITHVMKRIEETAALSSDIPHLMEALLPLARVLRYGSVRQTDKSVVEHVVSGLLTRICVGLPSTCAAMNDDAAQDMYERLMNVHGVVVSLRQTKHTTSWYEMLTKLANETGIHGLLAGRACRLLVDGGRLPKAESALRLERVLNIPIYASAALDELTYAAYWLEGFLKGSGLLLLHDQNLWELLDGWVMQIPRTNFLHILPILRRVFSSFREQVRQQLGERVRQGQRQPQATAVATKFDQQRAEAVLPFVARLLGLKPRPS